MIEKVILMATKEVLAEIKQDLDTFVGTRVKLKSFKGRNRVVEREGVLESTYPNIFVIKLDEKEHSGESRSVIQMCSQKAWN